ncbi:5' nucleotidase, NT5C type [Sphingomonas sp. 3-13AW]|uniref:5' nucleotidase, NT5C type n=1 Tax=Sphingomonas sp. 3-13AW TaxID=3050450 RepID=UPI003BB523D0
MKVASDLDHVLCDLVGQARVVLADDLGVPAEEIVQTFVYHNALSHPDPAVNARIRIDHAFWERDEVMRDALPMPGAIEAAWRLYDAGLLKAYVTRRGPSTARATLEWLRRDFPPVPAHFVGTSDPKTSYAACKTAACVRSGATVLIDDSYNEVERVVDAGLSAILLDAPVGRDARRLFSATRPDILCLPSVTEAVDHILAMQDAAGQ